ncbi:MAG: CAP domain-containing protein [Betaproteobacteria bacterium]
MTLAWTRFFEPWTVWTGRLWRLLYVIPLCGCALWTTALMAGAASAQDGRELIGLINAYRSAPQTCEGKRTLATGPLVVESALAGVQSPPGGTLLDALKKRGYLAAVVHTIEVSGPTSAGAVMEFIKRRYCSHVLSGSYAGIGIAREGDSWRILLARPLLSPVLGQWRNAGNEILRLTNAARAESRRCASRRFRAAPPVAWSNELAAAALAHSRDMANRNYLLHRGMDGSEVGDRARRAGYAWAAIGENIAAGQGSPEQAVTGWLSSPPHCANVMSSEFAEMGAAYAVNPDSDATIYWTQVFGTAR